MRTNAPTRSPELRTLRLVAKHLVVSLVLFSAISWASLGMAADRLVVTTHGQFCLSIDDQGSNLSMFIADVWPALQGPNEVLEDTTVGPAVDLFAPSAAARMAAHLDPPPMSEATWIWEERWGPDKRPSAGVIRSWLAAQQEQSLRCSASSLKRWQIRLVSRAEASAIISSRPIDPQKPLSVIYIGVPGFNKSGTEALLNYSSAQPGLSGRNEVIFYAKKSGHWHEAGRMLLSVS